MTICAVNRSRLRWLAVACAAAVLVGCEACSSDEGDTGFGGAEIVEEGQIAILPLGDSRVQGARPDYESYRYELWTNLVGGGYVVNFVGPLRDDADYPVYSGMDFDREHGGIGGDRTTDVLDRLDLTLAAASRSPDVVLLGVGGNDLLQDATPEAVFGRLQDIISRLRLANPEVLILVEQIAPPRTDSAEWTLRTRFDDYNARIATLASESIVVVNMVEGWTDDYLADPVHYSERGAKVVADRYFAALEAAWGE